MQKFRAASLAFLICLFPASAWAICQSGDAKGTYQFYAVTHGISGSFWTSCRVRVRANGAVVSGTSCVQKNSLGQEAGFPVDGGVLRLSNSCRITGNIQMAGFESNVETAWMSIDKNLIEGVGVNVGDGSIFRFSAIRR